jgi:hexosaminidase
MKKLLVLFVLMSVMQICYGQSAKVMALVPYPQKVVLNDGFFDVAGVDIRCIGELDSLTLCLADRFASNISFISGKKSDVKFSSGKGVNLINDQSLSPEAYELSIKQRKIEIRASSLRGFNWALQTLKQLMPVEIYSDMGHSAPKLCVPCCDISDSPRFGYRGLHLDEARHFFGVETVKKYIDVMEIHKLNTLHWHLTDDQGWRIQIKKYPLLTETGSIRKETLVGRYRKSNEYDGVPYGKGLWYTHDQIREIVDYAAARGISIIPEIDLPGHMQAALTAYPHLGCTGGPYEVRTTWGISEDVLCIGKECTIQFIKDVLDEVCSIFPSEYIHIGGDECPKVQWKKCPHCQDMIKKLGLVGDGKHSPEHFLQSYVTAEAEKFLAALGRKLIGWDEILEGEIAPNATVMSWRGTKGGLEAVRLGHDVIMTPNDYFYFDYYQSPDKENEPIACGWSVPVEKCYSFEPFTENMNEEEKSHILGVQANLWTEYIATQEHLEYMLLPRMAALSEVQWCTPENKSWERFLNSAARNCERYEAAGYNFAKHILQ